MKRILFLCHGNICRSAAAEAIFLYLLKQSGRANEFEVDSAAISYEEIGNPMYPPMRRELESRGIPIPPHRARKVTMKDVRYFDEIFYMDRSNERLLSYEGLLQPNVKNICIYSGSFSEIEDPWYTGRYGLVADQITACLKRYLGIE